MARIVAGEIGEAGTTPALRGYRAAVEVIPGDATDDAILAGVCRWIGLMAVDDFAAAAAFLHAYEGDGASLRQRIEAYEAGKPLRQEPSRVTPAETAGGPFDPLQEVFRRDDGSVSSVDFAMPINGEWSELVAFFDVVVMPRGFALSLRDIYVA